MPITVTAVAVMTIPLFSHSDEGNWRNEYPDEESGSERSSCSEDQDPLQYRYRDAYLGQLALPSPLSNSLQCMYTFFFQVTLIVKMMTVIWMEATGK